MRNFKKLQIWQLAIHFAKNGYDHTTKLPKDERFGLKSQIRKCLISIPSNIAEGSAKSSEKDFSRFLQISLGSAFEVETQFILMKELGYLSEDDLSSITKDLSLIQRKISALIKIIKAK